MKWRFEDRCAKQMDAIKKVLHIQNMQYCIILYMYIHVYNTLSLFLSFSLISLPFSLRSFPSSLPPSLFLPTLPLPSSLSPTPPYPPYPSSFPFVLSLPSLSPSLLLLPPSPSLLLLQGINDIFPLSMLKIFDEREIEVSSIIQYAFRVLPVPMMIGSCIYIHDHYLFKLCYLCTEIFN